MCLQETQETGQQADLGLRVKEILLCLRIPLTSPSPEVHLHLHLHLHLHQVRAGTLRAVRHLVRSLLDVMALVAVQLHLLVTRTIDLDLDHRCCTSSSCTSTFTCTSDSNCISSCTCTCTISHHPPGPSACRPSSLRGGCSSWVPPTSPRR